MIAEWLRRQQTSCRTRLVVVILLAAVLVALVAAVAILTVINVKGGENGNRTQSLLAPGQCVTSDCRRSAARLLEALDEDADPCVDFYQFACGGWNKNNPIPESEVRWDQGAKQEKRLLTDIRELLEAPDDPEDVRPVKQARALYRACLNTDELEGLGVQPLRQFMERLGLSTTGATQFDVVYALGRSYRMLGLKLLFNFRINEERLVNTTRHVMVFYEVSPGISQHVLLDPERFQLLIQEYIYYIRDMVAVYRDHDDSLVDDHPVTLNDLEEFGASIVNFSTQLAKIMTPLKMNSESGQDDNADDKFYEMSVPNLQNLTGGSVSQLNFSRYLDIVFNNTNVTLDFDVERVYAHESTYMYLKKLALLLANTDPVIVERFVWWNAFSTLAPLTLQKFRDLSFHFRQRVLGLEQPKPRWTDCTESVNQYFGMAVSYLYVREHFDDQLKSKALEMVSDVRVAFSELVGELEWMDERTKARTLEKAEAMRPFIGFPDWLLTPGELEAFYKSYEDVRVDQLFETLIRLSEANVKYALEILKERPDHNQWSSLPTTINAFYSPTLNSLIFPAGMLQPPFYGLGLESLNYGATGAVMGHELTHGFDGQGRRYDKDGNLKQWWTEATYEEYQQRVQCFIDQYDHFKIIELGNNFTVNGVSTLNENIADNGGLREAYRAYRMFRVRHREESDLLLPGLSEYSPEQLFFLGYSQMWCGNSTPGALKSKVIEGVHSPNRYRVLGTLSNTQEFADAWRCPSGSPMNPHKKCVLW